LGDDRSRRHPHRHLLRGAAGHRMKPLILASKSPRRRELLSRLGIPFEVRTPEVEEPPPAPPPGRFALLLAEKKARTAWEPGRFALGADTVVAIGDRVLGKPKDPEENARFLRLLSGTTHTVYTAAAVVAPDGRVRTHLAAPRFASSTRTRSAGTSPPARGSTRPAATASRKRGWRSSSGWRAISTPSSACRWRGFGKFSRNSATLSLRRARAWSARFGCCSWGLGWCWR